MLFTLKTKHFLEWKTASTLCPPNVSWRHSCSLTFKNMSTKQEISLNTQQYLAKADNIKIGSHTTCAAYICFGSVLLGCFAVYACPVWERSAHAKRLDPVLNENCRLITGCQKPTNAVNLHLLAGVAPTKIQREPSSKLERSRQTYDPRHILFNHQPAPFRLKSRGSFLHCEKPLKKKSQPGERKSGNESSKRCHKALAQTSHRRKSCLLDQTLDKQCGDVLTAFVQAFIH